MTANILMIAAVIGAYLIGSVNSSILLSKGLTGEDIRTSGSGNAGATNMLRTHGKKMGVLTLILDILKGTAAVFASKGILYELSGNVLQPSYIEALPYMCAAAVIIGHDFPVFFKFKGGKGVATSLGAVLVLDWKIGLMLLAAALIIMVVTRYVSLGSIVAGAAYIIAEMLKMLLMHDYNIVKIICVLIIGSLLIIRHHANISRLLNGTENKLGKKRNEQ